MKNKTGPQVSGRVGALWREGLLVGLVLVAASFLTRATGFGHPDMNVDETFYFAAGLEILQGAIPFVDVWDRKPAGHFLIFAAIAAISDWYVTYQIVAALFAAATAGAIYYGARAFASRAASMAGAVIYLLSLCLFDGVGGQSAVFYNAFMAAAGVMLLTSLPNVAGSKSQWRIAIAMALAGIAITIKTTAVFEAVFFGIFAASVQIRSHGLTLPTIRRIAGWAALGAAPSAAIAAWYWAQGYWDEYWTAMVLSNLRKPLDSEGAVQRLPIIAGMLAPLFAAAAISLAGRTTFQKVFLGGWIGAAVIGFLSIPAGFLLYAMPLLVPLCLTAPGCLAKERLGFFVMGVAATVPLIFYPFLDFAATAHARQVMDRLVEAVERGKKGGGDLLVFDGPPLLYPLTNSRFPTPLAFPNHLHQFEEQDVSHIPTIAELKRILAARPAVIVDRNAVANNREAIGLIDDYVAKNCRVMASESMIEDWSVEVTVYGQCRLGNGSKATGPVRWNANGRTAFAARPF